MNMFRDKEGMMPLMKAGLTWRQGHGHVRGQEHGRRDERGIDAAVIARVTS